MDPSEYVDLVDPSEYVELWIQCGSISECESTGSYVDPVNPCENVEGRGDRGAVPLAGSVPASEAEVTRLSIEYHV